MYVCMYSCVFFDAQMESRMTLDDERWARQMQVGTALGADGKGYPQRGGCHGPDATCWLPAPGRLSGASRGLLHGAGWTADQCTGSGGTQPAEQRRDATSGGTRQPAVEARSSHGRSSAAGGTGSGAAILWWWR